MKWKSSVNICVSLYENRLEEVSPTWTRLIVSKRYIGMRRRCLETPGRTKMMEPSFEKLLARLTDFKVDFILVGGLAVALNGYVRLTEDIDILLEPSQENVTRFLECMKGFGEGFGAQLDLNDFNDEEGAIRIVEDSENCQIDVFMVMGGFYFRDIEGDAVTVERNNRPLRHASRRSLIRMKSNSQREKDKIDIMALEKLEEDPGAFD